LIKGKQIYHIKLENYKLLFTAIPKNANSSLKYVILKTFLNKDLKNIDINNPDIFHSRTLKDFEFITNQEAYELKDYLKIVIARNPYDRLLAGWFNKIKNLNKKRFGFDKACNFNQFIKIIWNTPEYDLNRHFIPQYRFVTTFDDNLIHNNIIKLEEIKTEWPKLQKLIYKRNNINLIDFPILNATKRDNDYQNYYNDNTIKLVEDKFKQDLELFNYSF
jgi:hypothetical protein